MQKSWDGKTKGGVSGYKIFVLILKYLGLRFAYFFLIFVSFWFVIFHRKGAKAQYNLFKKRLKYSSLKAHVSVFKNHYIFGQILIDKIAILSGLKNKFSLKHTNSDVIKNMITKKTGGILINAHIGSWEIAGQLLDMYNGKIYVVMLDVEHEQVKNYLSSVTGNERIEIIPIMNDGSHVEKIANVLKNKGIIAMHGDRFVDGNSTVEHEFFGQKAKFPTGPFHLAAKYKVPFSFASAFKEKHNTYHFIATEPQYIEYPGSVTKRNEEIRIKSEIYVKQLEDIVKKYPLQWFNYYNFWET